MVLWAHYSKEVNMCSILYDVCNWICDSYTDVQYQRQPNLGCTYTKVYITNPNSLVSWAQIPPFVDEIAVVSSCLAQIAIQYTP